MSDGKKLSREDAEKIIRERLPHLFADGAMRVVMAPHERVDKARDGVERLLAAIDHPEAVVTDLSSFADMECDNEDYAKIKIKLGITVLPSDLICEAAERLRA